MLNIAIELRKYAGTRGGRAVLVIVGGLAVALAVIGALVVDGEPLAVSRALTYPMTMLEIGLPVVVVLLFTSEWSTRDVVQSFVLRPRRGVVLRSKCVAAVIIVAAGLALGLVTTVLALGVRAFATDTPISLAGVAGTDGAMTRSMFTAALYAAFATGIGLLVARTAIALVIYLGAITVVETMLALSLGERSDWLSLGQAVGKISAAEVHAADLPSLATSVGLWIVAPLVVGWAAFMRREAR
jgi:ABC-2 type transport system permease protein